MVRGLKGSRQVLVGPFEIVLKSEFVSHYRAIVFSIIDFTNTCEGRAG